MFDWKLTRVRSAIEVQEGCIKVGVQSTLRALEGRATIIHIGICKEADIDDIRVLFLFWNFSFYLSCFFFTSKFTKTICLD